MSNPHQIKKTATILLYIIGAVILWFIFQQIRGIILSYEGFRWSVFAVVSMVSMTLFVFVSLGMGASLLYSVRQAASPFCNKNVKKLKVIAGLLIVFEPYFYLSQRFFGRLFPIVMEDGTSIVTVTRLGGIVLVAGLIVYCVALVFQYGISLQNQVDETL